MRHRIKEAATIGITIGIMLALILALSSCGSRNTTKAHLDGGIYMCPSGTFTTVEGGQVYCHRMDSVNEDAIFGEGQ